MLAALGGFGAGDQDEALGQYQLSGSARGGNHQMVVLSVIVEGRSNRTAGATALKWGSGYHQQ